MRPRRLLLFLLAGMAAFPTSGCSLCQQGAATWCPRSAGDQLNDPPEVAAGIQVRSKQPPDDRGDPGFDPRADGVAVAGWDTELRPGDPNTPFGHFAEGSARDPDGDPLLFEWDLDGDGEFERSGTGGDPLQGGPRRPGVKVETVYRGPGAPQVTLRVSDFPQSLGAPGVVERTRRVTVLPAGAAEANRRPQAAFTATPLSPRVGERVIFDASGSSDPDLYDGELLYNWIFGDGSPTIADRESRPRRDNRTVSHTYATPGDYTVTVSAEDAFGLIRRAVRTLTVLPADTANAAPTASFTVSPRSPAIDEQVTLDASSSSDPDGPIVRYEWDLDGDGDFETDRRGESVHRTSFTTPGERVTRLRVTDDRGATATARRVINVRYVPPESAFAAGVSVPLRLLGGPAKAPARRVRPLGFSARLMGAPLPRRRGRERRRGPRRALVGVLGSGRLRAQPLARSGRMTRAERRARAFLRAPWHTRVSFGFNRRTRRLTATATALALAHQGSRGRHAACLRVKIVARPGAHPTGRLRLLGGRGAGARLRASGRFIFRLERSGSTTAIGRLAARSGAKRPLPRSCKRFARRSHS